MEWKTRCFTNDLEHYRNAIYWNFNFFELINIR